jgi:hypothetical protein
MTARLLPILIVLCSLTIPCFAQESPAALDKITNFPEKFIGRIDKKAADLESGLDRQTEKYLQRLLKKEKKLKKKLQKQDSAAAAELFANIDEQYASPAASGAKSQYLPHLDTLKTSLSFLEKNSDLIGQGKDIQGKLQSSLQQVKSLQSKLQDAEQVKAFIKQRREQIKQTLSKYVKLPKGLSKAYTDFNKDLYYYSQQVQEYKDMLNDPDKLTRKALDLLSKTSLFKDFMSKYSELAALFPMPDNYGTPQALAGLQTRAQVQQAIQTQLAGAGPNAQQMLQQNLQAAQQQLNTLKDKINKLGGGGGSDLDADMPDFKPNNQKTKSFLQRLELGTNMQSTKSNYFFPTTTDLGLSVGYRLSDKSTIGIGGSYKVGWGKDIRNIVVTSQGAALRSFLDVKLKGSFFVSGGYEYNYQPAIAVASNGIDQKDIGWTQSGLVGLSKIVSLKTKFFKKTKVQLLYDFLSHQQEPKTQALKFRVGYNF